MSWVTSKVIETKHITYKLAEGKNRLRKAYIQQKVKMVEEEKKQNIGTVVQRSNILYLFFMFYTNIINALVLNQYVLKSRNQTSVQRCM